MSRNVTGPIAESLIALIEALAVTFTVEGVDYTETVTGYRWSQNGYDRLPAGAVLLPEISRRETDQAELEIGKRDYLIDFPVEFLFDIDKADHAQELALATVEAFIDAIDDSGGLSGTVDDIVVAGIGTPVIDTATPRPLIVYPTTVQVLTLVSDS